MSNLVIGHAGKYVTCYRLFLGVRFMGNNHRSYQGNPLSINGNRSLSFKALLDKARKINNYRHLPLLSQAERNIYFFF